MPREDGIREPSFSIQCPLCMHSSSEHLFEDVDKSKPMRLYTDSPTGTMRLSVMDNFGKAADEEIKINRRETHVSSFKDPFGIH